MTKLAQAHHNELQSEEPDLWSIHTKPDFAISQRAFLLRTPAGNVLWDTVSLIDAATVDALRKLGGLAAIAISHPHFYTSMVDWSHAFGGVPIYLHEGDAAWVPRKDGNIKLWRGSEMSLLDSLKLVHVAGHFDGSQVLHWPAGAEGRGVLLSSDEPFIARDRRWVTFMRSFPNFIPLGERQVREVDRRLSGYRFDRMYGAFPGQVIARDAANAVRRSAARYVRAMVG